MQFSSNSLATTVVCPACLRPRITSSAFGDYTDLQNQLKNILSVKEHFGSTLERHPTRITVNRNHIILVDFCYYQSCSVTGEGWLKISNLKELMKRQEPSVICLKIVLAKWIRDRRKMIKL